MVDCETLGDIEGRLKELGASLEEEAYEEDIYYAHPSRSMMATDEAVRLRRKAERRILAYKGPRKRGAYKARTEIEVECHGPIEELLEKLGFKPAIIVRKNRKYYRLGEAMVTLDKVENLGCFIEIEAPTGEVVEDTRSRLQVKGREVLETYVELLASKLWEARSS